MNPKVISSLRNISNVSKRYCSNQTERNKTAKSNQYSSPMLYPRERLTIKLRKTLDDPSAMQKAYCSIVNTSLNNKKISNILLQ